ncbi:HD-GYP domain-containing protein [Gorillibacterium massiliense]|uniref:HD-GYP domain-containing protein n=1 Tax=Gorillibacterium massiliense TaxID=1280390 RepID=UPI0004B2B5BB|nr:HD-GYP domain-containing protein [Gorillibacterium massiliense]
MENEWQVSALRVHIMDLRHSDVVLTDTFNTYGLLVLSAGSSLDEESISKLFQHSIDYVDIAVRRTELSTVGATAIENPGKVLTEVLNSAVYSTKELYTQAAERGEIDVQTVDSVISPMMDQFRKQIDIASILLNISDNDDYTYRHSVQVGIISYYIAKWMGKNAEECALASKAGYLHDIGKCKIPPEILNKQTPLTNDEFAEIRKHPIYGFDIINDSVGNPHLSLPALQHHERFNGSGYPYGIKEQDMHPLSKIVAIADIYSACISNRVYGEQKDLLNVLYELYQMSFGQTDPYITQIFIRNMLPNLIGKKVVLNNGDMGKIVMTNPSDSFRPLVQVDQRFIDLAQTNDIRIERIVSAS